MFEMETTYKRNQDNIVKDQEQKGAQGNLSCNLEKSQNFKQVHAK